MSIRIDGTNTTANPGITGSDTDTGLQIGTNEVKVVTDGTAQATFDNSGSLLFTREAASSPYPEQEIKWSNDSTTNNGFYIKQNDDRDGVIWHQQGLNVLVGTNDEERLRVDPNGNVGIGTGNNLNGLLTLHQDDDQLFLKQSDGDSGFLLGSNNTNGNLNLVRRSAGSNTTIATFRAGGGLTFNGDTAAANALDDYEEGTWTSVIRVEGQGSNCATDEDYGHYIKIGNVVHCWGQNRLAGDPSGKSTSAAIELRGFPFAHRSGYDKISHDVRVHGWETGSTYGGDITFIMRMLNNQQYARIEALQAGYDGTRNASLTMKDNTLYAYSFTYEVA